MKVGLTLLLVCLAFAACSARPRHQRSLGGDFFRRVFSSREAEDQMKWTDCSNGASAVKVESLVVSPSTLNFPGSLQLSAAIDVTQDLTAPIKVDYKAWVKIALSWFAAPCHDIGGCHFDDLCAAIPKNVTCPEILTRQNISCHCPLKQGRYAVPTMTIPLPAEPKVPSIANGHWKVQVKMTSASGASLLCLEVYPSLKFKKTRSAAMRRFNALRRRFMTARHLAQHAL